MENIEQSNDPIILGARPAVIEHFAINGLFGYRSVSLSSKYAATILIAKNGAGKTTLLGAMDAFLKCQFERFSELQFTSIECRLYGIQNELILKKSDLDDIVKKSDNIEFIRLVKQNELDPMDLLYFISGEYPLIKHDSSELYKHPVYQKIYLKPNHNRESTIKLLDYLENLVVPQNSRLEFIRSSIKKALSDVEVVYLPTYRRIELSLPESEESKTYGRTQSIQVKLGLNKRGLQSSEIQFGLSDISSRLAKLNQDMLIESNQGYREISANIINDLINGALENDIPNFEERPSKEALDLFFSRLKEGGRFVGRYAGPYPEIQIPDFEKIYSEAGIPEQSRKFLTYFLGKLNRVMQKTRDIEVVVEEFVQNCNRYLSTQDESVDIPSRPSKSFSNEDNKILTLNRRNLGVTVSSLDTNRKIPLDALSSGEKQMISLFARLYLFPKKKILLIDEPELSLSIDWQRKILVDIVSAHSCQQVIAITHSPFIFDNSLEPFATSLKLKIDVAAPITHLPTDDEDELHA